jgi:hypothetical protein
MRGDIATWWRGRCAPRLVLPGAPVGLVVMTLGPGSLGALLTHRQGTGDVDALPWSGRDILAMAVVGALVLLAILP